MDIEHLKTVRLLLLQLSNDAEKMLRQLPDMSEEREALLAAYTKIQKTIIIVESRIMKTPIDK